MIDQALRAIAEPRRRHILDMLRGREQSTGQIASRFTVSRPAISQHLAVLVAAGLVTRRKEGTRRLYKARIEGLEELRAYLEGFWMNRLEAWPGRRSLRSGGLRMTQQQEADTVQIEVRIAARPETVFSFFTDPEKITRWQGIKASLDPRPGGIYRVDMNGRDVARGEYLEVVSNSRPSETPGCLDLWSL